MVGRMSSIFNCTKILFFAFVALSLAGCDNAYFSNSRQIGGDYFLEQWEDFTTYYIEDKKHNADFVGSGAISGVVVEIGWDKE
jgi:hypothetical protein